MEAGDEVLACAGMARCLHELVAEGRRLGWLSRGEDGATADLEEHKDEISSPSVAICAGENFVEKCVRV